MPHLIRKRAHYRWLIRGIILVAGILVVGALARTLPLEQALTWLRDRSDSLGIWSAFAFGTLFILGTLVLVPGWPMTVAAGAVFGVGVGSLVMWVASLVSAGVGFLLGRTFARERVARHVLPYPRLRTLYRSLGDRSSWKVVAAVRLSHALPFGLQNLIFGLTPIGFWPYLISSAVVMLPGTCLYAYVGHLSAAAIEAGTLVPHPEAPNSWLPQITGLIVAALALTYVARFAQRTLRIIPDPQ